VGIDWKIKLKTWGEAKRFDKYLRFYKKAKCKGLQGNFMASHLEIGMLYSEHYKWSETNLKFWEQKVIESRIHVARDILMYDLLCG